MSNGPGPGLRFGLRKRWTRRRRAVTGGDPFCAEVDSTRTPAEAPRRSVEGQVGVFRTTEYSTCTWTLPCKFQLSVPLRLQKEGIVWIRVLLWGL